MTMQEIFLVGVFGVVGIGIFMLFLLGIVETLCMSKKEVKHDE